MFQFCALKRCILFTENRDVHMLWCSLILYLHTFLQYLNADLGTGMINYVDYKNNEI